MLKPACALFVAFLSLLGSQAQSADERRLERSAKSGVATVVAHALTWDRDCNPRPTDVTITAPPANGSAGYEQGTGTIPTTNPQFGSVGACGGKSIAAKRIMYRSLSGFQGIDMVSYVVVHGKGQKASTTITITVK